MSSLSFSIQRRVEFADTDMAGIVHFSNFFRMMESTEHAFLRALGFRVHATAENGTTGWPRVRATCEYLKPVRFEEVLEIQMRVAEIRNRSVCYRFEFFRASDSGAELVAKGEMVAVFAAVDSRSGHLEAIPISNDFRKALEPYCGS